MNSILETIGLGIHWLAAIFTILNPFMMVLASCLWIRLWFKTHADHNRICMRAYVLEQQIEYLICKDRQAWDPEYINCLKKLNERYGK